MIWILYPNAQVTRILDSSQARGGPWPLPESDTGNILYFQCGTVGRNCSQSFAKFCWLLL